MICPSCQLVERRNLWTCPKCLKPIDGGVVFLTGISGSGTDGYVADVARSATKHGHKVVVFDVGEVMHRHALEDNPDVRWDRILDQDETARRCLRALAFNDLQHSLDASPDHLHLVDLHMSFRWKAYLTRGVEPHILDRFRGKIRCFANLVANLSEVQAKLAATAWGERERLELLLWRDEELFLTDLFSDVCGRVDCWAVSVREPPIVLEQLIWHPTVPSVYLSFPMRSLEGDKPAREEIERFRDEIRSFLVVFDPSTVKDYAECYSSPEMKALRKPIGETTEERDYRFIDQADAVVVYFPKAVASTGVEAEMNHARRAGKPIFLCRPGDQSVGPFAVPASRFSADPKSFVALLRDELTPRER